MRYKSIILTLMTALILTCGAGDLSAKKKKSTKKHSTTAVTSKKNTPKSKTSGKSTKKQSSTNNSQYQMVLPTTESSVHEQQAATKKAIAETSNKLKLNATQTKKSLNELNHITAEIKTQEKAIHKIEDRLNEIKTQLTHVSDSIHKSEKDLNTLRTQYAKGIKAMRIHSSATDKLMFLFSSESFHQAFRRLRYLQEFSKLRGERSNEIHVLQNRLQHNKELMQELADEQTDNLNEQTLAKKTLVQKKNRQATVVNNLKKEGKQLQAVLAEKQRQSKALDRQLERIIAEQERKAAERAKAEEAKRKAEEAKQKASENAEQKEKQTAEPKQDDKSSKKQEDKKPAPIVVSKPQNGYHMNAEEQKLSGSFADNKGRLPHPVSGHIVAHFGKQKHPDLPMVVTDNGGIDIEAKSGSDAHAVFDGKVSAVFQADGCHTVVMLRHGNYLTIYVNLASIYVKMGQNVKTGQALGKIYSDPSDNNRTILHFEVRNEKTKLNPEAWLK